MGLAEQVQGTWTNRNLSDYLVGGLACACNGEMTYEVDDLPDRVLIEP